MLDHGHRLPSLLRHLHGLYAGHPGARAWRRFLGEQGVRPDAGVEVLRASLRVFAAGCVRSAYLYNRIGTAVGWGDSLAGQWGRFADDQ
ncbi:MAG: hypothetical protein MZV65_53630 [Chromatiales bacterium]|nr:hypothetical protein [Chromatiales bacterium]